MQQKNPKDTIFFFFLCKTVAQASSSIEEMKTPKHRISNYVTETLKVTIFFVRKTYLRVLCRSNSKVPRQGLRKAKRIWECEKCWLTQKKTHTHKQKITPLSSWPRGFRVGFLWVFLQLDPTRIFSFYIIFGSWVLTASPSWKRVVSILILLSPISNNRRGVFFFFFFCVLI